MIKIFILTSYNIDLSNYERALKFLKHLLFTNTCRPKPFYLCG